MYADRAQTMSVEIVEDTQVIVRVSGEVELPNVDKLRSAVESAAMASPNGFVIDMNGVSYIDSAGISALVFAYRRVCPSGGRLALVITDKNVRRIVTLTRLHTLPGISLHDDINEALSALGTKLAGR
ncbi:STAS domain-containing protein [bacterium]|nr:STAS domain-containing protein [bacterium]